MSEPRAPEGTDEYDELLDDTEHHWRNRLICLAVLAALVVAGGYALWAVVLAGDGESTEEIQTAEVGRGSISVTVSTTGVVAAQSTTNLSFEESGRVSAVNVTLGQEVKQGDVLAEIESDALQDGLVKAEANLTSAQIKLNQLLEGADAAELASADQSVTQAQANYDQAYRALQDLYEPPSDSERLSAEQAVSSAQSNLAKAQDSRAKLDSASEDAIAAAEEAVSRAEDALEDAEDAVGDAEDDVDSAEASLKSAETAYCLSPDYPDPADPDPEYPDAAVSFCTNREAPISSADQAVLMEITVTGSPDLATKASSALSANTSYENALEAEERAEDAVDSAEEDLTAAEEDLEDTISGPTSEEIASADASVVSAQQGLDLAIERLAELYEEPTGDELAQAQNNLDTAAASLAAAQAKHDDVYAGADWQDIELQRNQVQLAEVSVERAREDLDKAQIIAPFDGTVAALNIEVGEVAGGAGGGGEAAVVLNTPDAVRLNLTITETDRPSIQAGQLGFASFDAIPDVPFPIVIESVGTSPTTTQGVVTYEVRANITSRASLDAAGQLAAGQLPGWARQADAPAAATTPTPGTGDAPAEEAPPSAGTPTKESIPPAGDGELPGGISDLPATLDTESKPLPGMNASVTIIVDQAQDVLTVPSQAIQSEGRDSVVEVQKEDGTTERVVVETGLSDGTNTEIVSGLEEGQTIIVPSAAAVAAQTTPAAGFPGPGFRFEEGGPPGEGGPIIIGGGAP